MSMRSRAGGCGIVGIACVCVLYMFWFSRCQSIKHLKREGSQAVRDNARIEEIT
jgi:hypothetical protein